MSISTPSKTPFSEWNLHFIPNKHLGTGIAQLGTLGSMEMLTDVYADMAVNGTCFSSSDKHGVHFFTSFSIEGMLKCNITNTKGSAEDRENRTILASALAPDIVCGTAKTVESIVDQSIIATSSRMMVKDIVDAIDIVEESELKSGEQNVGEHDGGDDGDKEEVKVEIDGETDIDRVHKLTDLDITDKHMKNHIDFITNMISKSNYNMDLFVVPISGDVNTLEGLQSIRCNLLIADIKRVRSAKKKRMDPSIVLPVMEEGKFVCGFSFSLAHDMFKSWSNHRLANMALEESSLTGKWME